MDTDSPGDLGVADAIAELRKQLMKAQARAYQDRGRDDEIRFTILDAEVVLGLEAKYDAKAGTKLNFGVVSVDLGGGVASTATHHVKVRFQVRNSSGGMAEVSRWDDFVYEDDE